jgi:hypothetical protein
LNERPGETKGEQAKDEAPQDEQKDVFQPALPRHARRRGLQEHDGAEAKLLPRRAPNEMKNDGRGHGEGAQSE